MKARLVCHSCSATEIGGAENVALNHPLSQQQNKLMHLVSNVTMTSLTFLYLPLFKQTENIGLL
jgi:hypothetical protein